jgi:hypothetical protein
MQDRQAHKERQATQALVDQQDLLVATEVQGQLDLQDQD